MGFHSFPLGVFGFLFLFFLLYLSLGTTGIRRLGFPRQDRTRTRDLGHGQDGEGDRDWFGDWDWDWDGEGHEDGDRGHYLQCRGNPSSL